jgi:hypothetical protein
MLRKNKHHIIITQIFIVIVIWFNTLIVLTLIVVF